MENKQVNHYFPSMQQIFATKYVKEDANQPDFYVRSGDCLCLFECKAFKLNGAFKEKGLVKPLIEEFYKKTVHGSNQRGKDENSAVRQLMGHISRIYEDDFIWDEHIPDEVAYYPVIVFEDTKLVNVGVAQIIQNWYQEELSNNSLLKGSLNEAFYPIVTLSIYTLFLYKDVFRKRGFAQVFDMYYNQCATYDEKYGWHYKLNMSFDEFMSSHFKCGKKKFYDKFMNSFFSSPKK